MNPWWQRNSVMNALPFLLIGLAMVLALVFRSCAAHASIANDRPDPGKWIAPGPTHEYTPVSDACTYALEQAMRTIERYLIDPELLTLQQGNYGVVLSMDIPTYQRYVDDRQFFELIKGQCWSEDK